MRQALNNFFLSGFHNASYFEKRKATYLLYIIVTTLSFLVLTTVSQVYLNLGHVYQIANLFALVGLSLSLFFFKLKKINTSGPLMACSIMIGIAIEAIGVDYSNNDPSIRYRLYINFASLL